MSVEWSAPLPPSPLAKDEACGYVRALISRGSMFTPGAQGWAEGVAGVAARAGVVALEDEVGRTVLLGTTADARRFITARCVAAADGKQADVGAVTARALVVPVASGFEADLVYLAMARERTPGAHAKLMARWGVWVVRLDARDDFPEARAMRLEEATAFPAGTLLGPVSEQGAARLSEAAVDAFDLCRYPHILRQAPRGAACAYKEMGRCPAPCDGSEAMETYRVRVRDAVRAVGSNAADREAGLTGQIKQAATAARFEEAAALKKALERIRGLDSASLKGVTTMDRFRHCVVAGGSVRSAARIYAFAGGRLVSVVETKGKNGEEIAGAVRSAQEHAVELSAAPEEAEAVSVLARWAAKPAGKRRVGVVRVNEEWDIEAAQAAVRSVIRTSAKSVDDEVEETEHRD